MSDVTITTLVTQSWETYKSLRLASLKDAPDSFGSTFERETEFSEEEWKSRITATNGPTRVLPLVAEFEGSPIGLAWGVVHTPKSKSVHVYQMWVSPEHRGTGVGRQLLDRIIEWTHEVELSSLSLAVTTINIPAIMLYESLGFLRYGKPEPLRDGSPLVMQSMEKTLGTHDA